MEYDVERPQKQLQIEHKTLKGTFTLSRTWQRAGRSYDENGMQLLVVGVLEHETW